MEPPAVDYATYSVFGTVSTEVEDESLIPPIDQTSTSVFGSDAFSIFMAIYFSLRGLQALLAIVGNVLTIVAVGKYERLQTTTNVFVVSLAVNDLISGLVLFPLDVWSHYWVALSSDSRYYALCLTKEFFLALVVNGNVCNICLIAVERFLYLHFPIRYPVLVSEKRSIAIVVIIWLMLIFFCALFVPLASYDQPDFLPVCDYNYVFPTTLYAIIFADAFGVVSAITVFVYIKIGYLAIRKSRTPCSEVAHARGKCQCFMSSVQMKVTKMLAMVLGIYFGLYLPAIIITPFVPYENPPLGLFIARYLLICLWFANSWCNPLIYAWQISAFRSAFRKMLHLPKPSPGQPSASQHSHSHRKLNSVSHTTKSTSLM